MPDNNGVPQELVLRSPFCFLTIFCSDKTVIFTVQALALVLKTTQVFFNGSGQNDTGQFSIFLYFLPSICFSIYSCVCNEQLLVSIFWFSAVCINRSKPVTYTGGFAKLGNIKRDEAVLF